MIDYAAVKELLATPKEIAIISHRNPDGDAIGSSLGLMHYLTRKHHNVFPITPSEYPDFLEFLPGIDQVQVYDIEPERVQETMKKVEVVFCLDFNDLERVDKVGEMVKASDATVIMIDHHLYPEPFAEHMLSDAEASSTCELIYDFLEGLGAEKMIDPIIADCLFTGILTDTGSFKYSTSPKLFRIVAQLLEQGADDYRLQDLIFNSQKEKNLRLLGHCLYNRMEILPDYHTGIIWLSKEDYDTYDIKRGDTEGIVNYLLKLKGIKMAAFIMEQPTIVKISLRSKGEFSVQEVAKRHFRGGGHRNASGGASFQSLEKTIEKFKSLLPRFQQALASA